MGWLWSLVQDQMKYLFQTVDKESNLFTSNSKNKINGIVVIGKYF